MSVVNKILALPGKERLWPNCLDRPVRNTTQVNVEEYFEKVGKAVVKYEGSLAEKSTSKSVADRVKSRRPNPVAHSPSKTVLSLSSESGDKTSVEVAKERSVGRQIAKGIRLLTSLAAYSSLVMCFTLLTLMAFEPFIVIVEFKPPSLHAIAFSSKDLFAKRNRDEKSTETESSKATTFASPESKRLKTAIDQSGSVGKMSVARATSSAKYDVGAKPGSFVSSLKSSLHPQIVKAYSSSGTDILIADTIGNAYHVSITVLLLRFLFHFVSVLHLINPFYLFLLCGNHCSLSRVHSCFKRLMLLR